MWTAACRDSGTAAAADEPRIEMKAAVAPLDGVTIHTPIEGRVATVAVSEGSAVQPGAVLITLTNPAVDRDLAYARAQLLGAEARSRSARTAPPPASREGENAAADVMRSRKEKLDRYRGLLATGDVSRQEVENAEAEYAAARRDWLAERERRTVAAPAADPALLQAEIDRARADLAFAEHRRSQLTIAAPSAGSVAQLRVRPGDDVYPRDVLLDLVDAGAARVQAQIAPELLRFVRVGQPVDVKVLTIPPRRFREPIARVTPPGAQGGASIVVNVPNPDRSLQPGTPAVITVQ